MNKSVIASIAVVVVIVIGLGIWGFKNNVGKAPGTTGPQVAGEATLSSNEPYFDNNASVMEFYQETCEWCIKESPILQQLSEQGYRVKPMNIGANHPENQHLWQDYKISGTPTFVASNGDHLDGYQNLDTLKSFLDMHK